nr:flagellar protein FliT [uncultured Deefgea sp.]
MAVLEDTLAQIDKMMAVLIILSDLAEHESWDDLLMDFPKYEQTTTQLPQIKWAEFSAEDSETLRDKLVKLQELHDRLIEKMAGFRSELKELLQNSMQSRKLNEHYR